MEQTVFGGEHQSGKPRRPLGQALWNGFRARCPRCGKGRLFRSFLKTVDACEVCGEHMHHHRADDLPAYLVIALVGHIVVAGFLAVEATTVLTTWQHLAIWVPVTLLLSIGLLRPVKGAVVGLQWALHMHGFSGTEERLETHPEL